MLLTVSFRLMFCNTVAKAGCDMKKSELVKLNFIFVRNLQKKSVKKSVTSFVLLFVKALDN